MVKSKFRLLIALMIALVLSSGSYAYTFTTDQVTVGVAEPLGDVVSCNATETQPDWSTVLSDLSSEGKTQGEVPAGDIFTINPDASFGGDIIAKVYLSNSGDLAKAYSYFNAKLYLNGSVESGGTPSYRLLTLQNGEATLTLEDLSPVSSAWTETSQADFADSTLNQVDVNTSPGDVILSDFSDNVTDSFADQTKIASSANVTVSGGQVILNSTSGSSNNETLRPTGDGDETTIEGVYPITPSTHWDKVDDVTSDGNNTYVRTLSSTAWTEDLYQIANHSTGSGQINYVRVYAVASHETSSPLQNNFRIHIKTNGVEYNGTELTTTTSYTTYSYDWNTNPQTGSAWTWTEIDNIQAGVSLTRAKNNVGTRCTQVYVQVNYTETSYEPSGTVTSTNLLSADTVSSIDSFDYTASVIPSGTSLKVHFSQNGTSWYNSSGTLNGWDTLSVGMHSIDLSGLGWSGSNFYYHILFTSDTVNTPALDEIVVYFSTYYSSGDLTSSAFDTGYDLDWDWGTISFTINEPSTTNIQYQIRTAATQSGLSSATWYGPTGTSDYYTTSGTTVNSVHDSDRWIQYKAYFTGPGDYTPTFSDISITYSAQSAAYTIEITGGSYALVSDNTTEWDTGWTTTPEFFCEVTPR